MDRLLFLGTGAGDPLSLRRKSSALLQVNGLSLLIDAGEPCTRSIVSLGGSPDKIDAVFLTHFHADHVGGLPLLLQANLLLERRNPLRVFLPPFAIPPLLTWLAALSLAPEQLSFPLDLTEIHDEKPLAIGPLSVTPFATTHDHTAERQSLGFRFTYSGHSLHFSGDLGAAEDLAKPLAAGVDGLVCELAHLQTTDLIRVLKKIPLEVLLLTHLTEELLQDAEDIRHIIDSGLPLARQVFLPGDGESFPFPKRASNPA